ncbi:MAG: ROK family transcriptional regulator [Anaerolineales bacterium]|jgi:predicted NBD/HSP70 family sugar kinase
MPEKKTLDQTLVRESNLSSTLRLIHNEAPLSRAQLATRTGLNKSTVSSLIEELLDRKLIHETGMSSVGTGRPATMLEINPQAGCIIGVEFGVDFVSVGLANFVGQVLWRQVGVADPAEAQDTTLAQALELVSAAIVAARSESQQILGLGLALPGMVDLDKGVLIFAPYLNWHDVPMRHIFSERTGLKIFVENDANAAAVAENLFGVARQSRDFVFVYAGVGIGGGIFLNGRLYRGKGSCAGEIGRSPIMSGSFQASESDHRGLWETYANQNSVIQRVKARLDPGRSSLVQGLVLEPNAPFSISAIEQAADGGDEIALEALAETGVAMGQGFATLVNFLNPEKIILGGPLSIVGKYLLPSLKKTVNQYSLPEIGQQVEVVVSEFGLDASLIGAIAIVVEDVLTHPALLERR